MIDYILTLLFFFYVSLFYTDIVGFQEILFSVQNRQWCFWGTDVKSPQQLLTVACAKPHNQPLLPRVLIQTTSPHRHRISTPQTKHSRHAAKQQNKIVTILHFHHKPCWSGKTSEMSSRHSTRHYMPRLLVDFCLFVVAQNDQSKEFKRFQIL